MRSLLLFLLCISFSLSYGKNSSDTTQAKELYKTGVNFWSSNLDSAAHYIQKAADIFQRYELDSNYFACLNWAAQAKWMNARYDESLEISQNAIAELEAKEMRNTLFYAQALFNVAVIYEKQGHFEKAHEEYQKSIEIYVPILGEANSTVASIYHNRGILFYYQAEYDDALAMYDKSLNLYLETIGEKTQEVSNNYENLGNVHMMIGDYTEALESYFKCLEIRISLYGEESVHTSGSYTGVGSAYQYLGNYEKAERYLLKSLDIQSRELRPNHPNIGYTLFSLGTNFLFRKSYAHAVDHYERALVIFKEVHGVGSYQVGIIYESLGIALTELKEFSRAQDYILKSLDVNTALFEDNHPQVGHNYLSLASSYIAENESEDAFKYLELTAPIYEKSFGVNNPEYYYYLRTLLEYYILTDQTNNAIANFRTITDFYKRYINQEFHFLGESEREQLYNSLTEYFEIFQNMALQNPALVPDLFNLQLGTKSILLNATNQVRNRIVSSGDRVMIGLYDEVQDLKQKVGKYSLMQIDELEKQGVNFDSLRNLLDEKDQQLSEYASFYALEHKEYTWQDVQGNLDNGEAVIEVIRMRNYNFDKFDFGDSVYYAFLIVTPKSKYPELVVLKNGLKLEGDDIQYYRNSIYFKNDDFESYINFWDPLKKSLKGIKTVYFSPDGVYNLINLSTLYNAKKDKYLFEEIEIRSVTSARDLWGTQRPSLQNKYSIFIGDPDFGTSKSGSNERSFTKSGIQRNGIASLPGTAKEIEIIGGLMSDNGWRMDQLTKSEATEEKVKTMLKPKVLHIATHGFFEEDVEEMTYIDNPLYRSGLLFAGAQKAISNEEIIRENVSGQKEDGILSAFEVMNLNVDNTDLVVLSACETGLGEIRNGEGVYGLQRAFKLAGARSIIFSLWKVDDQITQEFMVKFYENWMGGMSKRQAFRGAQEFVRIQHSEPYYWGAFLFIGE